MSIEHIKSFYNLDVFIGQKITYKNITGAITEITNHIGVNLDDKKAGHCDYIHPLDDDLIYFNESKTIRKMTRSQRNYQKYLRSESDLTFGEWMGFA